MKYRWNVRLKESNYSQHLDGERIPQPVHRGSFTLRDVVMRAMARRARAMAPETVMYAAEVVMGEIIETLMEGGCVNLPIGRLSPAVTGTWEENNRANPNVRAQNRATIHYVPSPELKELLSKVLLVDAQVESMNRVYINEVHDIRSDTDHSVLTPGGGLIITGRMLRMVGDLPERGVYFLDAGTGEVVRHIPADRIYIHTRGRLVVEIPADLPAGQYRLQVVSQCTTSSRPLKRAAGYVYPVVLTV